MTGRAMNGLCGPGGLVICIYRIYPVIKAFGARYGTPAFLDSPRNPLLESPRLHSAYVDKASLREGKTA